MKVRTAFYIDEHAKKVVMDHFKIAGVSLSSFVNTILCELAREIEGQPVKLDKQIKDLTMAEFGDLVSYWFKKVQ